MTFFEKRDLWEKEATKELIKNKDILDAWSDDSNLRLLPDGTITITYTNTNIEPVVFEKAVISIQDFFNKLNANK